MRAGIAALLLTIILAPAVQAAEPALPSAEIVPDAPPAKTEPQPVDQAVQGNVPGCAVWTDRCVTCERAPAGRIFCSNIGMTCQPQAIQCVRSEAAAEKENTRQQEN